MENIFTKFINFIKRILKKEEQKLIPETTVEIKKEELETNFVDELRLHKEEDPILLELQDMYEKGEMDLSIMSNEQIHELNLLYKRQVSELKKNLNNKKTELGMLQYEIKNYLTNM